MMFTKDQIEEIKARLALSGVKDTELPKADMPFTGDETIAIVQNGENRNITYQELYASLEGTKITDVEVKEGTNTIDFAIYSEGETTEKLITAPYSKTVAAESLDAGKPAEEDEDFIPSEGCNCLVQAAENVDSTNKTEAKYTSKLFYNNETDTLVGNNILFKNAEFLDFNLPESYFASNIDINNLFNE